MGHRITIRFEAIEDWETNREIIDDILEKDTGTRDYPSTRSLPPIIIGPEVSDDGLQQLKGLQGVVVTEQDDD